MKHKTKKKKTKKSGTKRGNSERNEEMRNGTKKIEKKRSKAKRSKTNRVFAINKRERELLYSVNHFVESIDRLYSFFFLNHKNTFRLIANAPPQNRRM